LVFYITIQIKDSPTCKGKTYDNSQTAVINKSRIIRNQKYGGLSFQLFLTKTDYDALYNNSKFGQRFIEFYGGNYIYLAPVGHYIIEIAKFLN